MGKINYPRKWTNKKVKHLTYILYTTFRFRTKTSQMKSCPRTKRNEHVASESVLLQTESKIKQIKFRNFSVSPFSRSERISTRQPSSSLSSVCTKREKRAQSNFLYRIFDARGENLRPSLNLTGKFFLRSVDLLLDYLPNTTVSIT